MYVKVRGISGGYHNSNSRKLRKFARTQYLGVTEAAHSYGFTSRLLVRGEYLKHMRANRMSISLELNSSIYRANGG